MGIMTSFSYTCIVWITICVDLLSAEDEFSVSAYVGSTAVLPCKLPNVDTETPHISWTINSQTVFERLAKETHQGEGYEGRVEVPEDELRKGNCSLVLYSLTRNDAEVYMSYQIVSRTKRSVSTKTKLISRVKLAVSEKPVDNRTEYPYPPTDEPPASVDSNIMLGVILVILVILLIVGVIVYCRLKKGRPGAVFLSNDDANTA